MFDTCKCWYKNFRKQRSQQAQNQAANVVGEQEMSAPSGVSSVQGSSIRDHYTPLQDRPNTASVYRVLENEPHVYEVPD